MTDTSKGTRQVGENDGFEVSPEADAAETAAIAKMLEDAGGDDDVEEDDEPTHEPRAKASGGKKAVAEEEEPSDEPPVVNDDEDEDETPAKGEDEEQDDLDLDAEFGTADNDAQFARSVKALELDGWSAAELKTLPREVVVKMGEKRASEHVKLDRLLSSKKSQVSEKIPAAEKPDEGDDDAVKELAEELGGDERAREKAKAIVANIRKPLSQIESRLTAGMERMEAQHARTRLLERFPQLASSKEFGETFAQAKDLFAKGNFRSLAGAMQGAAKLRYADELIDAAKARDSRVSAAKKTGTVMGGGKRGKEPKFDRDFATDKWLERRLSGDRDGAKRFESYMNG